ncbi:MAG: 4-(cytidine 5'-diphospho)-2-C-methyl-D-erythritol kinase [Cyanobacteria bacterium]|nr:4-(cytidine 5'-diphospho)-2-C-methyl-D-erythritol kinase [Cyanobacteriota bacterium]
MPELTVLAPAKINLHLEVLGLRADGYHELAMVMQSLDLADTLVFNPTADGQISLSCDNADLPTDGSNLIVRAAELLRARSGLPELGARIDLQKRIPIGAGLAGGSSDGAAALVGLNALWGCGFSAAELLAMAAALGSDMPFCLEGGSQLCFGRGERLEPLALAQPPGLGVLLIKHPQASVSTPWAYGRCREMRGDFYLEHEADFAQRRDALRHSPLLAAMAGKAPLPRLRNDLQAVVEPEVESVRQGLALLRGLDGALAVAMSGSGPSLFALFSDLAGATAAQAALAGPLAAAGFESWCCRCTGSGATLGPAAAPL